MRNGLIAFLIFCIMLGFAVGELGLNEWQAGLVLLLALALVGVWMVRVAVRKVSGSKER